jgi:hypothetical protein
VGWRGISRLAPLCERGLSDKPPNEAIEKIPAPQRFYFEVAISQYSRLTLNHWKLLTMLNAMLKHQTPWRAEPVLAS